jgi:hypothetical protein
MGDDEWAGAGSTGDLEIFPMDRNGATAGLYCQRGMIRRSTVSGNQAARPSRKLKSRIDHEAKPNTIA